MNFKVHTSLFVEWTELGSVAQGEVIIGVQVRHGVTWDQLGDGEDGGRQPGLREAEWSGPGG